ncbi:MAG: hypothetical protein ACRC2K_02950 [Clostridium sp.]
MSTNEKERNNYHYDSNDYYKPAYYSNKSHVAHTPECHDDDDCDVVETHCPTPHPIPVPPVCPKPEPKPCKCCKHALQEAMKLLFKSPFNSYIDPTKFTLFTPAFSTAALATQIKNITSCNGDGITFSDGTAYTYTTFCDLSGFNVQLLTPAVNVPLFLQAIQSVICAYDPHKDCCYNDSCCCNSSKAAYLAGSLSTVNIKADGFGALTALTVAAVTDDLAIFVDKTTGVVSFVCLNALKFIG